MTYSRLITATSGKYPERGARGFSRQFLGIE
ncbi:hypothetical protein CY0110_15832 [Crocosphaera chwakensis CCY0110]|uniref:Uncharacterized protein n=1 Tax=Crocosphaera chwakensis CCY0110 TaxID=391612 RepID=A3IHJ8_9CHRO|nr:hypothetical protein CY0110_15832 [Crocosphaera chwakensis CCY0110]